MKNAFVCFALALGTLATPVLSFAQSNAPVTRAEVRADLVRAERAGYTPSSGDEVNYPADIQAAEAKIAAQSDSPMAQQSYGGSAQNGTASSGTRQRTSVASTCVGPVSFCNIFFGS
jgi:hypothetical protein